MSGVEVTVVGLALGVLPVLISAAEHYDDCLRPFIRYKNFAIEADRFRHLLGIQKIIFRNQCRILLEEIVEHDVATTMLNSPSGANHPSWSDVELDKKICKLLGDSREACIATIGLIEGRLRDIACESRDLETTIDQEAQVSITAQYFHREDLLTSRMLQDNRDPVGGKPWRRRIARKLRFSFSKPRLSETLSDLRSLNDDFRTLSSQTLISTSLNARRQEAAPAKSYKEVERYHIIGQASRQVYEALGKACTKHTEHEAHFCVEVEQATATITGDHSAHVKFNMAYTHLTLAGSADHGDLIWFTVDSTSGDAMQSVRSDDPGNGQDNLAHSLKRQIDPPSCTSRKKPKKSVRFQSSTLAPTCPQTMSTAAIATANLSNDMMRKDFCDFIRRRFREPFQGSECVGMLVNTDSCSRNLVYPPSNAGCHRTRQAISLGQVISGVSKRQAIGRISLYDRLHLAKTLAIAVLQYHSTPWLKMSWRSEDVYFGSDLTPIQEPPKLASPHLNVKVKGPCGQPSRASTFPSHNLARNSLLFSLGVVLLEIAYVSKLECLQSPLDLDNGRENRYTEFFAARRLAKATKTDMGQRYHRIVERLVECDFGCGTDLSDPQLQAAFHHEVICPLEKLERKLHEFHFD